MYSLSNVLRVIQKIRREMGLKTSIEPKLVYTVYREDSSSLPIITEDRPDKAAILGPGGWVLKRVREELEIKADSC